MTDPNARPPFRRHATYYVVLKVIVVLCALYFAARLMGYL